MLLSCSGMAPAVGSYVMNGSAAVNDIEMMQAMVVKIVRVMLVVSLCFDGAIIILFSNFYKINEKLIWKGKKANFFLGDIK